MLRVGCGLLGGTRDLLLAVVVQYLLVFHVSFSGGVTIVFVGFGGSESSRIVCLSVGAAGL
jgi:hypothetical protein